MEFDMVGELGSDEYTKPYFEMCEKFIPLVNDFLQDKSYGDSVIRFVFGFNTLSPYSWSPKDIEYYRKNKSIYVTKRMYNDNLLDLSEKDAQKKVLTRVLEAVLDINKNIPKKIDNQKLHDDLMNFFILKDWI